MQARSLKPTPSIDHDPWHGCLARFPEAELGTNSLSNLKQAVDEAVLATVLLPLWEVIHLQASRGDETEQCETVWKSRHQQLCSLDEQHYMNMTVI